MQRRRDTYAGCNETCLKFKLYTNGPRKESQHSGLDNLRCYWFYVWKHLQFLCLRSIAKKILPRAIKQSYSNTDRVDIARLDCGYFEPTVWMADVHIHKSYKVKQFQNCESQYYSFKMDFNRVITFRRDLKNPSVLSFILFSISLVGDIHYFV